MKQSRSFYAETAMYIPRQFALSDDETEAALAQAGFAHLVTHDSSGLMVTPLPLLYDEARHSLIGHVSRANPHWHADGHDSVAIFSGPHAYISPSFYATKAETGKVVPTWNYEVLNVYGRLVAHDDAGLGAQPRHDADESARAAPRRAVAGHRCARKLHARAATRDRRRGACHLESRRQGEDVAEPTRTQPDGCGRRPQRIRTHRTISSSPTASTLSEARTRTAADSPTHSVGTAAPHRPPPSAPPPTTAHSTAIGSPVGFDDQHPVPGNEPSDQHRDRPARFHRTLHIGQPVPPTAKQPPPVANARTRSCVR